MKTKAKAAGAPPEAIMPLTDFRARPWPDGEEVAFKAGLMSAPVPAEFAEEMRTEGKAAGKPKAAAKESKTAADHG